jgi:DNA-binding MarR family transcriptional regulator
MATRTGSSPVTNPLDEHFGYQLRRASSLVMATLADRLAELRLTIVETSILVLIDRNPGIFQSEIGRVLGIKRANVAPLASSLERRDLVSRTSPEGRAVGLSTTAAGHELAARAEALMRENDEQLFEHARPETREMLRAALEDLWRSRLERIEAED